MPENKKIDNSTSKIKKKKQEKLEVNDKSYILKEKKKFLEGENVSPEVKTVLEDVFTDMIKDDSGTDKKSASIGSKTKKNDYETQELKGEYEPHTSENKMELKSIYEDKVKDLQERIEEYKKRYDKLEDTIDKYEVRNKALIEKRKEYD